MKLLFICTHNRCRSILSEAITNHFGQDRIEARSAGSQPVGAVHPLSIKYLAEAGIATAGLQSQSWNDFADYQPDAVITVCDSAAAEACPLWMGSQLRLHWGLTDPSKLQGSDAEIAQAFAATIHQIKIRVLTLLSIPSQQLNHQQLQQTLAQIVADTE